jgi:hypothetical protein
MKFPRLFFLPAFIANEKRKLFPSCKEQEKLQTENAEELKIKQFIYVHLLTRKRFMLLELKAKFLFRWFQLPMAFCLEEKV